MRKLNQSGDTIIEVLVSLSVLAFVLVLAYSITNRALTTVRASQERVEALKLAEGQVESLKALSADRDTSNLPVAGEIFCVKANLVVPNQSNCSFGQDDRYKIVIKAPNSPSDKGGVYTVNASWNRLGSSQQDILKLEYKTYEGIGQSGAQ